MNLEKMLRRAHHPIVTAVAAGALTGLATLAGFALPQYSISQKGRQFHPDELTIRRGETLQMINDDGDLLHHAYVDSTKFSFDSRDQKPGSKTNITFPVEGDFEILCGIHPKMKLVVHVR